MGEEGKPKNLEKQKDFWDKVAQATPLLLGILVTGVGAVFTHVYNFRQLQLNQIAALDKLRPLLTSSKPEEREFGYSSFAVLGYEDIAIRLIKTNKDQAGRAILLEIKKEGGERLRTQAIDALKDLDEAQKMVLKFEGEVVPGQEQKLGEAKELSQKLGISSKLGVAILFDTMVHSGPIATQKLVQQTAENVKPPLTSRFQEKEWLNAFLEARDKRLSRHYKNFPGMQWRIEELKRLVKEEDWDLKAYQGGQIPEASLKPPAGP